MADVTLTNISKTNVTLTPIEKASSPRFIDLPITASYPHAATWESTELFDTHKTFLVKTVKNNITLTNISK